MASPPSLLPALPPALPCSRNQSIGRNRSALCSRCAFAIRPKPRCCLPFAAAALVSAGRRGAGHMAGAAARERRQQALSSCTRGCGRRRQSLQVPSPLRSGSPLPHLHRDWAATPAPGLWLAPATSAPEPAASYSPLRGTHCAQRTPTIRHAPAPTGGPNPTHAWLHARAGGRQAR